MKLRHHFLSLCIVCFAAGASALNAAVKLGMPFSDHMVLQSGAPVPVWGTADADEKITVQFSAQTKTTTADAGGKWRVTLDPMPASTKPREMIITSSLAGSDNSAIRIPHSTFQITDVLVGEVWLCSGQSNMRFSLGRPAEPRDDKAPLLYSEALANSANPRIRLLSLTKGTPANRKWGVCGPENTVAFSAVGYFFGAALEQARDVPVGLIELGQAGASIRVFIPQAAFDAKPELVEAFKNSKPSTKPQNGTRFEGDMVPLAPFAARGVLWYQGESDVSRAAYYPELLRTMIAEWRRALEAPELTFLVVQLPPWQRRKTDAPDARPATKWPEMREVQAKFADTEPSVELAVIADLGERLDIHPRRKREVGERLAMVARAKVYGESVEHSGPVPVSSAMRDGEIEITFKHVEGGLFAIGDQLEDFEVAGDDGKFVAAKAHITGHDKLVVTPPQGVTAKRVRYAWRDWFQATLFNASGWPAGPFNISP